MTLESFWTTKFSTHVDNSLPNNPVPTNPVRDRDLLSCALLSAVKF